jgi:hypothetical protein
MLPATGIHCKDFFMERKHFLSHIKSILELLNTRHKRIWYQLNLQDNWSKYLHMYLRFKLFDPPLKLYFHLILIKASVKWSEFLQHLLQRLLTQHQNQQSIDLTSLYGRFVERRQKLILLLRIKVFSFCFIVNLLYLYKIWIRFKLT